MAADSSPSRADFLCMLLTSKGGSIPDREKKELKFAIDLTAAPDNVCADSLDLLE